MILIDSDSGSFGKLGPTALALWPPCSPPAVFIVCII